MWERRRGQRKEEMEGEEGARTRRGGRTGAGEKNRGGKVRKEEGSGWRSYKERRKEMLRIASYCSPHF